MARTMNGKDRVTVFPLLHMWPNLYGVVAYVPTGHHGSIAVMGYIPIPEVPDVSLLDVGARFSPHPAEWVLCTGWSSRVVRKPGTLVLDSAEWVLEVDGSTQPPKPPAYGHTDLHVGRFTLTDPDLMTQARDVLPKKPLAFQ
ncbi:hypothetical protein OG301_26590 [Streptomyces platensis]|uniref:hypothetical protein n=1 Tax=Streptomyces platensis TaxID=58346 RepID=UPI002ED5EE78|nr:hypothetical protein OG301_26590 [Streptomyces platensis]